MNKSKIFSHTNATPCGSRQQVNMSTRWYPLYRRGNPQLRVFLPNFYMKLIKPRDPQPKNVVQFEVSMQMTKFDIKNYLEKIYNVPVENVVTHVRMGQVNRSKFGGYLVKEDDFKVAYVSLPATETFEFPDLFPEEKKNEEDKQMEQIENLKKDWETNKGRDKHRQGAPSWLGL
ncbi:39S ribosomal protein L23, mitochondrial-like [Penaeus japonicus]|uniref:39S ribosomal protein L23, mitochondrial-like n=2 Tax=Penaeus japonicus TaxID=27405 RepID=UPI001C714EBD|nr:39S ribosomal protein L23, mitochondrial-like [Penaeus japonicus]